jgi:hypothetical protein
MTTFLIIAGVIIALFIFHNNNLNNRNIREKFAVIIDGLNEFCYNGRGQVTIINKWSIRLYEDGSRQIVYVSYEDSMFVIDWRIKYFQQEMKYKKKIYDAKNIPEAALHKHLEIIIQEFVEKYKQHENKVNECGIPEKITKETLQETGVSEESFQEAKDFLENADESELQKLDAIIDNLI